MKLRDYSVICDIIVDIILSYRIPLESDIDSNNSIKEIISNKVSYFVENNLPIEFSISAFSLKSQIPWKCISYLPDMAEYEALTLFNEIINKINLIYDEWANINIFADWRLFVWLLYGFTDELVTKYINSLRNIALEINKNNIKIISLEDVFWNNYEESREKLFQMKYINTKKLITDLTKTEYWKNLIMYIRDFYAKDIRKPFWLSIKYSRIEWLKMAIWVLSRSKSWSEVIKETTNLNTIRFSCHPRPYIYEPWKIWIYMNRTKTKSCMPWHWVAVKTEKWFIYKRKETVINEWGSFYENEWLPYYMFKK